jgi:hypothetical protein
MKDFFIGVRRMPLIWQIWIGILALANGVLPLFFLDELIAWLVLTGAVTGLLVGFALVKVTGFTKLLGLMHAPWVPVNVLQFHTLFYKDLNEELFYWLMFSAVVSFISLVIDCIDVMEYLQGNRKDLLTQWN